MSAGGTTGRAGPDAGLVRSQRQDSRHLLSGGAPTSIRTMRRSAITSIRALPARLVLVAAVLAGCALLPSPAGRPSDAVRGAVERMAAHDISGAQAFTCLAHRDPDRLPFVIAAIFSPLSDVPPLPEAESFALIDMDTRELTITDPRGDLHDQDEVDVELGGALWLTVEPDEVEAAVRAGPRIEEGPIDEVRLTQGLARSGHGPVRLFVGQWIRVVREEGEWRVCELTRIPG